MIYSQLRKKIEEQKRQFQNSLKEIQEINNSPKIYQPYQAKNSNSSLKNSPQLQKTQKELITPPRIEYKADDQLITKLKQITQIKREDKVAKITSELEHYRKKSALLSTELAELKHLIQQKDEQMTVIENNYKQKLTKSAEKQAKIEQQEINLKTIIRDLRQILQEKDGEIAKLEGNIYEYKKENHEKREELLKQEEINRILKQENQKLQLTITQQKQIVSTFIDNVVNKINLFQEPILQIIQLKTQVISKSQQFLFFEELETKIKSMKENNQNKNNELNSLKQMNQQLQLELRELNKEKDQLKVILELKQNQIGRQSSQIENLEGQVKQMMSKLEQAQKQIKQITNFNQELTQKVEILQQNQKEIELKCQQKVEILVNQIKTKVDQIKEVKNALMSQNQLYEKDKKQTEIKLHQQNQKIKQYEDTYRHINEIFTDCRPEGIEINKKNRVQNCLIKLFLDLKTTKNQNQSKNDRIQVLQKLKNQLQIQIQLYKINYLKSQAQRLILQTKKQQLDKELKQKIEQLKQKITESETLRQKNQQNILQNEKMKTSLQKSPTQNKQISEQQMINLTQVINKIKRNCLKNNCDSIGIISIELNKILGVEQKILQAISSPTDFERFNKVKQINAIQEFQLEYDQKQVEKKEIHNEQSSSEELKRKIERKKSQEVSKVKFEQNKQKKNNKKEVKVKSVSLIEEQEPKEVKQLSKEAFSIENNPDQPEIVIPYSQLLQKYRDLKCDLQKMQEYICHVHSVNFKIKKGIQEADQHNKHNSIDKLSEKLSVLVKHNEVFLKNETQQFTNEIGKILNEIQNYIHFVDQISKIEPFTHEYNKSINKFNRLKRKVTQHVKMQKQGIEKHAYSQGDSRQDDFVDHFDAHPYEQDQDFPNIESQPKEIGKKQHEGMQKYFQENRQLYSQISSVKNKSLKSHNSFMNSNSQLWQLVKNKFTEDGEEHEHDVFKKQSNDSERLSQMSIKEIKTKYHKLKKENRSLNQLKNQFEKHCKKLELQENDYKKKIVKMTKQFNDSFKFLCQVTGKQIAPQKQRLRINMNTYKDQQIQTVTSPKILKIHKLSQRDEIIKRPQQMKSQVKIQPKQAIKQLELQNQLLKIRIKQIERKNDSIEKAKEAKIQSLQLKIKKYEQEFASFVKKSISKAVVQPQVQLVPQKIVLQSNRAFRKNSNSFKEVEVSISPPRQEPINLADLYQILNKILSIQKGSQLNDKLSLKQFQQTISKNIVKLKKSVYLQIVGVIHQQLQKFMHTYTQQQRFIQLQKLYNLLGQHFENNDHINELFLLMKEILVILKREDDIQIENLSVNSHCEDIKKPRYQEKAVQNQQEYKVVEQEQHHYNEIKQQIQFLLLQNTQLTEQLNEYQKKVQEKNKLIEVQTEESAKEKTIVQMKLQELEKQNSQLREEVEKSKLRGEKKHKIYHIGY